MPIEDARSLIGQPESAKLEYKLTLPSAIVLAKQIAAFANTEGGWLVVGVREGTTGVEVVGLSKDVPAHAAVEAALLRLAPRPSVRHGFTAIDGKVVYVIEAEKSATVVLTENGSVFRRAGGSHQCRADAGSNSDCSGGEPARKTQATVS